MKLFHFLLGMFLIAVISSSAVGQNFFDQLKQGVQKEINNAIRNRQSPFPGNQTQPPQIRSNSLPSEGGSKNIGNPNWRDGGDFVIQPTPQPQPVPQPNPYQPQPISRETIPYQPQPIPQHTIHYPSQPRIVNSPYQTYVQQPYQSSFVVPGPPVSMANKIRLHCTRSSQGSCSYTLVSSFGNYPYTISPGQEQRFDVNTTWKIRLQVDGQMKTFNLKGGKLYRLKNEGSGWQLYISE